MKYKILNYLSFLTLILGFIFIIYAFYLSFYPFEAITLNDFQVTNSEVKKGEFITYKLDFIKHLNIKPEISYYLVDGAVYPLVEGGINRPVGQSTPILEKKIPETINTGKYRLRIELEYPITSWRSLYYSWTSNEFIVKE